MSGKKLTSGLYICKLTHHVNEYFIAEYSAIEYGYPRWDFIGYSSNDCVTHEAFTPVCKLPDLAALAKILLKKEEENEIKD